MPFFSSMWRNLSRSLRSLSRQTVAMTKTTSKPTTPKRAVKMLSRKTLAKEEIGVAHPRMMAAAALLGQVASVTKAGEVLLT